jgi:thioredoxin-related protein
MEKANKEGKIIALMLGYQTHCPWCDRMDRYIRHQMEETKDFDNRVAFSRWQIEHAKMIAPPDEGVELKKAYGVEGQPWLFLIDKEGTVRYIYKMFVSGDVFKRAIYEILGEKKDVPVFDKE